VKGRIRTGSDLIVARLEQLGAKCIFGMPGTQNVRLYESLRKSELRTVVNTSELASSFMANGYARASGEVGVLTTIPGPGFAFSIPGIAEAFLDSAPLVWIVETPASRAGKRFAQQAIDQAAIAGSITKKIIEVAHVSELACGVADAYQTAKSGEPGPVLLHVEGALLGAEYEGELPPINPVVGGSPSTLISPDFAVVEQAWKILAAAERPVVFAGQGSSGASDLLQKIVQLRKVPVIATRSARGVLPEDDPLSVVFSFDNSAVAMCNELLDRSDAILALGVKFTHNGTAGFRLRMPREKLIHVDACAENLNGNYPARLPIQMDVSLFLTALAAIAEKANQPNTAWQAEELARWREFGRATDSPDTPEPAISSSSGTSRTFFRTLRNAMPRESCLVTDSGQHQILATRHAKVQVPRGLLIPTDFQSMGFGIPAAIGAKLAMPERCVVAIIGDGGLAMMAMELGTAVREGLQLLVVVFNDGALGQIRAQQLGDYGRAFATELGGINIAAIADGLNCNYVALAENDEEDLRRAMTAPGVTIVDLPVRDSKVQRTRQVKAYVRKTGRDLLPSAFRKWLTRKLKS
jgi:acetolactate synthase-1/2/3 large subunit